MQYFVDELEKDPELGFHVRRKAMTVIRMILREAQRRGHIARVPECELGDSDDGGLPGLVSIEEVSALIAHAHVARWPNFRRPLLDAGSVPSPAEVWETWFLMSWIYGFRTQDLLSYKPGFDGLLWRSVYFESACPHAKCRQESQHGWLHYTPRKTRRKNKWILLPLHSLVRERLERFQGLDEERVFPNGRSNKQFGQTLARIKQAAGVDDDVTISGTGQNCRSIRKGCSNNWDDVSLGLGLGQWVLGHARHNVHTTHYQDALRHVVRLICDLKLPALK